MPIVEGVFIDTGLYLTVVVRCIEKKEIANKLRRGVERFGPSNSGISLRVF